MITREDVADLRAGDVVEVTAAAYDNDVMMTLRGPLKKWGGGLALDTWLVRDSMGDPSNLVATGDLTVISRATPPLYVNSSKTEPDPGDVARDADSDDCKAWVRAVNDFGSPWYVLSHVMTAESRDELPDRLRLLVDGRTGQVVP